MFRQDDPKLQEIMRRSGNVPAHIAASPNVGMSKDATKYLAQKEKAQMAAAQENQRQRLRQQYLLMQNKYDLAKLGLNQQVLDQNKGAYDTQNKLNWASTGINLAGLAQNYFMDAPAAKARDQESLARTIEMQNSMRAVNAKQSAYYNKLMSGLDMAGGTV